MELQSILERSLAVTGVAGLTPGHAAMIGMGLVLLWLAIVRHYEPLILVPLAFGVIIGNIPNANLMAPPAGPVFGGLIWYISQGAWLGIYPPLIFLGIGALTDFSPLIANPRTMVLGAAAQLGIFITLTGALTMGFTPREAASIAIIGGADGPTALFLTSRLAPELLAPVSVAAYAYIALIPIIQPPIIRALTSPRERAVVMAQLRPVSRTEKVLFPVMVTIFVGLLVPTATPLVGMLMLGNLLRECGVTERLARTMANDFLNIVTVLLMVSIGASASADRFFSVQFLSILLLGLVAFIVSTASGLLLGKAFCFFTRGTVNPMIGAAGVSAVPEAARIVHKIGQEANPQNFLLMHAMGPNVAGVIGSALVAGIFWSLAQ